MSLAHNGNSQLADSNTGEAQGYLYDNGLSPLGREVIAEMNRLGMMVDLSHPSKGANMEAMRLSQAPVIASHSGVRALAPTVSRNMDDEQLLALKKNGGVIQVVGFASYIKTDSKERTDALAKLREEFGVVPQAGGGRGGGRGRGAAGGAGDSAGTMATRTCPVEVAGGPAPQGRRGGGGVGEVGVPAVGEEMQLSMRFHPNDGPNTTRGWLKSTQNCHLRLGPTFRTSSITLITR
jgi:membrane dipeptidase